MVPICWKTHVCPRKRPKNDRFGPHLFCNGFNLPSNLLQRSDNVRTGSLLKKWILLLKTANRLQGMNTWLTCHMTQLAAISYQTHPAALHLDSDLRSSNHYTHQHPTWINMTHFTFRCRFVSSTTLLIFISRSLKIFKSTSNSNTRFLFSWIHPWVFPGSKQQHRGLLFMYNRWLTHWWLDRVNHANQGGI